LYDFIFVNRHHSTKLLSFRENRLFAFWRQDPRWRISAILDFRGPIIGSLKSPCTTSYRSSIETMSLNCLVFEKIAFLYFGDRQTNKQTNRQTDRRTNKRTDRQTDEQTNEQTDRQTNKQTNRQTNRRTNKRTDRQTDEQTNEQTDRQTNKQTDRQTDEQMDSVDALNRCRCHERRLNHLNTQSFG